MPDYRRAHVPGGIYFFTVNTYRRQTLLTDADVRSALRETIERFDRPIRSRMVRTRALRSLPMTTAELPPRMSAPGPDKSVQHTAKS